MERKNQTLMSEIVGLAPVKGMCLPEASCSVIQGKHFESIYVTAHELGHNMGMKHDGSEAGNECDPSGYIMSPTLNGARNKWSLCSKKYLEQFLRYGLLIGSDLFFRTFLHRRYIKLDYVLIR